MQLRTGAMYSGFQVPRRTYAPVTTTQTSAIERKSTAKTTATLGGLGGFPVHPAYAVVMAASGAASAYHGYLRSRGSVGSAVGWGLLGTIFPILTPAVALAQGFGKPKVRSNRRRKRRRTSRRKR